MKLRICEVQVLFFRLVDTSIHSSVPIFRSVRFCINRDKKQKPVQKSSQSASEATIQCGYIPNRYHCHTTTNSQRQGNFIIIENHVKNIHPRKYHPIHLIFLIHQNTLNSLYKIRYSFLSFSCKIF